MNSIIPGDAQDRCYICGHRGNTEVHHMMHGSRRKAADKYGLTVHLCARCHMNLHDHGDHDKDLERLAQEAFEERYGHDEWMRIFGKNYRREE